MPQLRHPPNLATVVADEIRRSIEERAFPEGRLPSEPELARRLGVSRATLREAVTELEEAGLVRRRQGRGTFVTEHATSLRNILNENSGTTDVIAAAGWTPSTADVIAELRAPTRRTRDALGLPDGEMVVSIRRTRLADGSPAVAVEDTVPERVASRLGLSADRLAEELRTRSLYHVLDDAGLAIDHGIADLRVAVARGEIARRLGLDAGSPILVLDQVDFTEDDSAVLLSHESYSPDVFTFRVYRRGPGSRR